MAMETAPPKSSADGIFFTLRMLAGIIFDFDGVIADSHPVHLQAWRIFLRSMGKDPRAEDLAFVLEGAKREEILRHFFGELTPEQIRVYGAEKERLFQAHANEMKLIRGVAEFLEKLNADGIAAAVASSGGRQRIEQALKSFGLMHHFCAIATGDDVSKGKPDPALFLLAAERMNLQPKDILVCEDAVAGVLAAKAAGMQCLAIATQGRELRLREAGADLLAEDFNAVKLPELKKLFAQTRASRPPIPSSIQ